VDDSGVAPAIDRGQPTTAWASVPSVGEPAARPGGATFRDRAPGDRMPGERDRAPGERDRAPGERDWAGGERDRAAGDRDRGAGAGDRDRGTGERDRMFGERADFRAEAGGGREGGGRTEAWPRGPEAREQPPAPPEEAWWDGAAGQPAEPPAESAEKPKRSRWGRNKDKDNAGKGKPPAAAPADDWAAGESDRGGWATDATSRWDRNAARDGAGPDANRHGQPSQPGHPGQPGQPGHPGQPGFPGQPDQRGGPTRGDDDREQDRTGRGERIPEQRKHDAGAFEDLAPLELNLDEEPKTEKSRRFLRRK
jgi:hypothetical protein